MKRVVPLLLLFAVGCPASHGVDGSGFDGGNSGFDGGDRWIDAASRSDGGRGDGSGDAAGFEPEPCVVSDPDCYCLAEGFRRTPAHCITPRGEPIEVCDIGNGCNTPDHLCNDLGNGEERGPEFLFGVCTSLNMCAWLRSRDSRAHCYYEDGTLYDTGVLASGPCDPSDSGIVCGPGCGGCSGDRECVGVSERSGLGLCARRPITESPDRCGELHAECGDDRACVGFVLPDGISFASQESVWHLCVSRERCARLEARYSDRFYCRG